MKITYDQIDKASEKLAEIQKKVINKEELSETEEKLFYLDTHYSRSDAAKKAIKQNLL